MDSRLLLMQPRFRLVPQLVERVRQAYARGLADIPSKPRKGWNPPYAPPQRLPDENAPSLAHRRIEVFIRPDQRRALRRIRRSKDWIPGFLQGRGKVPDLYLRVPLQPIDQDYKKGIFVLQRWGKVKFCGPLYELKVSPDPENQSGDVEVPTEPVRAVPMNMLVHPITNLPVGLTFVYRPPDEPARVRVPIRYINEEKCTGLRDGWLNRMQRSVDIAVAAGVRAPLTVTHDLAGLPLRGKKYIGELMFERKGQGCRTVLPDDDITTIISTF